MFPDWDKGFVRVLSVLQSNVPETVVTQPTKDEPVKDIPHVDSASYVNDRHSESVISGKNAHHVSRDMPENSFMQVDLEILKAINAISSSSYIPPISICNKLNLDPQEFADRLELLSKSGYVDVLMGTYAPGMSLPNGIYSVRLTTLGRQILRETTPKNREENAQIKKDLADPENIIAPIRDRLSALLRQYQADWAIEKDSEPLGIDNGKYILKRFGSELFSFRPSLDGKRTISASIDWMK